MKKILGIFLYIVCSLCYIYLLICGALIEWGLIRQSLWQFFNPFILLCVLWQMLKIPVFYLIFFVGFGSYLLAQYIEKKE